MVRLKDWQKRRLDELLVNTPGGITTMGAFEWVRGGRITTDHVGRYLRTHGYKAGFAANRQQLYKAKPKTVKRVEDRRAEEKESVSSLVARLGLRK